LRFVNVIFFPVEHLRCGEKSVTGKPREIVCHICVGDGVSPVVGPGQVIHSSDENDCHNVVFAFLSIIFQNILLFHFECDCCLGPRWKIMLHDLSSLVIVNLIILIMIVMVVALAELNCTCIAWSPILV
jgi:hypothetical protein